MERDAVASVFPSAAATTVTLVERDDPTFSVRAGVIHPKHLCMLRSQREGGRVNVRIATLSEVNAMLSMKPPAEARDEARWWTPAGIIESASCMEGTSRPQLRQSVVLSVAGVTSCLHYWGGDAGAPCPLPWAYPVAIRDGDYLFVGAVESDDGKIRFCPMAGARSIVHGAHRVGRMVLMGPEANACTSSVKKLVEPVSFNPTCPTINGVPLVAIVIQLGEGEGTASSATTPPAQASPTPPPTQHTAARSPPSRPRRSGVTVLPARSAFSTLAASSVPVSPTVRARKRTRVDALDNA